eukprot:COSAG03_NODE_2548_length_2656_cov_2.577630_2_plen_64_part_00
MRVCARAFVTPRVRQANTHSMKKIAAPPRPSQWRVRRPHASLSEPTTGARKVLQALLMERVRP